MVAVYTLVLHCRREGRLSTRKVRLPTFRARENGDPPGDVRQRTLGHERSHHQRIETHPVNEDLRKRLIRFRSPVALTLESMDMNAFLFVLGSSPNDRGI